MTMIETQKSHFVHKRYYNIKWSTYYNTCKFNTSYKCTHKQKLRLPLSQS